MQKSLYLKLDNYPDRTIVVGDIHGCFDELQQLLEKVGFTERDLLISVGDLVDRGPASWEVVCFFRDTPNTWSVLGNHERRLVRSVEGTSQPAWSQLQTLERVPQKRREELLEHLGNLPAVIETPAAIVTHARLDSAQPVNGQDPYFSTAVGGPRTVIPLDGTGVPIWYRQWIQHHNQDKPICMGHIGYDRIELVPGGLYALDTGAVHAGLLTALVVEEGKIVQAPVMRNYFQEARRQWLEQQYGNVDPWKLPFSTVKEMMKQQVLSPPEQKTLDNFFAAFHNLSFEHRLQQIRKAVLDKAKELPASGPERGEVFRAVSNRFPNASAKVVRFSLSNHPRTVESLLNKFQAERHLAGVDSLLNQIERQLPSCIINLPDWFSRDCYTKNN